MDGGSPEMMQYFQNSYNPLIGIVNPIVITFKIDNWWLNLTENEGQVLPTEILAKQEKLFCNKLPKSKYVISGMPPKVWSSSINNYVVNC